MNLQNRKRLTDRKHTYSCQREGIVRDFGKVKYTLLYLPDNQQRPNVQHTEFCSMLCASLDESGVWWRMDACMCMTESLHCSPESTITLLISHIPIQNKKFKILEKKIRKSTSTSPSLFLPSCTSTMPAVSTRLVFMCRSSSPMQRTSHCSIRFLQSDKLQSIFRSQLKNHFGEEASLTLTH